MQTSIGKITTEMQFKILKAQPKNLSEHAQAGDVFCKSDRVGFKEM